MQKFLALTTSFAAAQQVAAEATPNPGEPEEAVTLEDSNIYSCIRNGHVLCEKRLTGDLQCVESGDEITIDHAGYICSDVFHDSLLSHSLASIASEGDCPTTVIKSEAGETAQLVYPHGEQKCVTVIGSTCQGPSFSVNTTASSHALHDYEVFWGEWDYNMLAQPSSTFSSSDIEISNNQNLIRNYPRIDEGFAWTGLASKYAWGYPGNNGHCDIAGYNCWINWTPTSERELNVLRSLPWGLGQPTSGQYDISAGGWHEFGAQGQSTHDYRQGFKPFGQSACGQRYTMILVQNKGNEYHEGSHVVIDMEVNQLYDSAFRVSAGLISALALLYTQI